MNKINMVMKNGVWIASVVFYNVLCVCQSDSLPGALRGLQSDMKWIELNLYYAVIRSEQS